MSFLPTSYFIVVGILYLLYCGSFALLLLSCGKLHRLEGIQAWRVAWYCILIEAVLTCLSAGASALFIYQISVSSSYGFGDPDAWSTANEAISYATQLFNTVGLVALIGALAKPLVNASPKNPESPSTP